MNYVGYYWRVDAVPIELASWAEREVLRAVTYYWTVDQPSIFLDDLGLLNGSGLTVRCSHGDWPNGEGETQPLEVEVDLVEELKGFAHPYADLVASERTLSDAQVKDVKKRAARLRELSAKIAQLADEAEAIAQTA